MGTPPGMLVNARYINTLHQTYILREGCPPVACTPSISGALGDTGVYRHWTEPISFKIGHGPLISRLAQHMHIHLDVILRLFFDTTQATLGLIPLRKNLAFRVRRFSKRVFHAFLGTSQNNDNTVDPASQFHAKSVKT